MGALDYLLILGSFLLLVCTTDACVPHTFPRTHRTITHITLHVAKLALTMRVYRAGNGCHPLDLLPTVIKANT